MSSLQDRLGLLIAKSRREDKKSPWGAPVPQEADRHALTVQVVDLIFEEAITEKASDIHIEPDPDGYLRVRYRVDGKLYIALIITDQSIAVMARIKIMAGLDTDAISKLKSQDSRCTVHIGNEDYDFRLSTFPTVNGEKMALRLIGKSSDTISLENTGLTNRDLILLTQMIQRKQGLLLVCGPTGSGKTTTLYSLLTKINSPSINVVSIEDPVEYRLPGVNQCDIKTKFDFSFADGLRAILRQDPNIILVGEIRDKETADIALRASMTGHLVLSSIHTNSAIGTIMRLINMGLDPYMVSYALNGTLAQRLVRAICDKCRVPYTLTSAQLNKLNVTYGITPDMLMAARPQAPSSVDREGVVYLTSTKDKEKDTSSQVVLYQGKGCEFCRGTGFHGRVGIFELVSLNEELREAIVHNVSSTQMVEIAARNGTKPLFKDALEKVKKGITTLDEVGSILLERS